MVSFQLSFSLSRGICQLTLILGYLYYSLLRGERKSSHLEDAKLLVTNGANS